MVQRIKSISKQFTFRLKSILSESDRASPVQPSQLVIVRVHWNFKEPITNRYCPKRLTEAGAKVRLRWTKSSVLGGGGG
jgi:hypothetical protein